MARFQVHPLIISFVFALSESYSQKHIDEIPSFQNLSFESSPSHIEGNLELNLTISYGLKYYKYRSKNYKEIYGLKIHFMNLGFRDDKLEYLDIYFSKLTAADFQVIIDSLECCFGESENFEAVEKGIIEAIRWQG
ncbi:MAG: hypothetical protein AAF149_22795 [Bacteroidota bacterium]